MAALVTVAFAPYCEVLPAVSVAVPVIVLPTARPRPVTSMVPEKSPFAPVFRNPRYTVPSPEGLDLKISTRLLAKSTSPAVVPIRPATVSNVPARLAEVNTGVSIHRLASPAVLVPSFPGKFSSVIPLAPRFA